MDLDNPSYFNVAGDSNKPDRKRNTESISSSSECSLNRQLTSPRSKMSFKTFGRSLSSNSSESSQFIRGEPRLSDLAPDLAAKHIIRQKSRNQNGVIYSSLAVDPESADSGDEVFIEDNTARYYNYTAGPRRHSVGSFAARERSTSLSSSVKSFKEELPSTPSKIDAVDSSIDVPGLVATSAVVEPIDDHAIRHGSYPRKRCNRCVKGSTLRRTNMDDILMVSLERSAAASLWVDYFTSYFQQIGKQTNRKSFKVHHMSIEDYIEARVDPSVLLEKSACVKLHLVVLCPSFLEYISEHPSTSIGKLFLADRTLALLLGVCDNDLTEVHRKALPTYFKWQRMSVGNDQDEKFAKDFISHAMGILARVWKQQCSIAAQEKSCFSVSPKKIRQGQSSVFILLAYPLQKEDTIKISVVKNNEMIEIRTAKRRNPYTIKISVPDSFTEVSAIIDVLVEKNGSIIGRRPIKCESRLRELEQILRLTDHPVEFMCQTLGFSPADRENLDSWLVNNFQKNLPPHFSLLASHSTPFAAAVQAHRHSHEEYPTLLHFAARFGLEKLALQLLDCPGADVAYEIKNLYDLTPAEIAEKNNFSELAASLRNYMNINEFSNMYHKLKAMSEISNALEEPEYLVPRHFEDCYLVCPPPRPVTLKLLVPSPPSPNASSASDLSPNDYYTPMHTPTPNIKTKENPPFDEIKPASSASSLSCPLKPIKQNRKDSHANHKQTLQQKFIEIQEDKHQKELMEIINDFKNNVHSISQVEKLVEDWKNRNDVQKSFREKQEQLKEMRIQYEKIQQEIRLSMKKSSPFERIKNFFARRKSHDEQRHEVSLPTNAASTSNPNLTIATQAQRPVSSLSTSSSGSSGRMSTISGCSLGDSGAHSENEERKNIMRPHFNDDLQLELSKAVLKYHYSLVPAPKPIKCINSNKTKLTTTIEETTSSHARSEGCVSEGLNDQYYIQFPPSGMPVAENATSKTKKEVVVPSIIVPKEYMNITSNSSCFKNEQPLPKSSSHEYMNYRTPTSIK